MLLVDGARNFTALELSDKQYSADSAVSGDFNGDSHMVFPSQMIVA